MITVMREALVRAPLDKENLDQVIVGNCFAPIEQNVARVSLLVMGVAYEVPGYTINCVCTSASQAVIMGAQVIMQGKAHVVLAGELNP